MTLEPIAVTEQVQKDGELVEETRYTLQHTPDPHSDPIRNQAMGVLHPDYVPASEREYTYNPETGMSESRPRTDEDMEQTDSSDYVDTATLVEATTEGPAETRCLHPIGSGLCQLEAGHAGSHRMYVE